MVSQTRGSNLLAGPGQQGRFLASPEPNGGTVLSLPGNKFGTLQRKSDPCLSLFSIENRRFSACCFSLDTVSTLPSEAHPPKPMVSVLPHSSGGDTRPAPHSAPPEKTSELAPTGKPCTSCRDGMCVFLCKRYCQQHTQHMS